MRIRKQYHRAGTNEELNIIYLRAVNYHIYSYKNPERKGLLSPFVDEETEV